jgi:hypothetical protein
MMFRGLALLALCSIVSVSLVGCGGNSDLGQVTGTVTMDGAPLPNALVTFTPTGGGRGSTGTTDDQGKYILIYAGEQGALIGEHKVTVTSIRTAAAQDMSEVSSDSDAYEQQAMGDTSAYDNAETTETIPAKYNTQSELLETVESGSNEINLELTSS